MKNTSNLLLSLCAILVFSNGISYEQSLLEKLLSMRLHELWTKLSSYDSETLSARIVGGQIARNGEFPYMVALRAKTGKLICGGSLLNSNYVLTAAHCVQGVNPTFIRIMIGVENLNNQPQSAERTISRVFTHNYFDFTSFDYDVAILELSTPVQMADNIQPICLSAADSRFNGRQSVVVGWGRRREADRRASNYLRKVTVPVVNSRVCQRSYKFFRSITDRMLCAGLRRGGKDSCQGDSGGPMIIRNGSKVSQIGIVSWGNGCARPGYYGVYTRIGKVLPWIKTFTNVEECD